MSSVKKIISGGQIGADQAALQAARTLRLKTGGTMPHGFMVWSTLTNGPVSAPMVAVHYGLVEGPPDDRIWPKRTEINVRDADATFIFSPYGNSPGSMLTERIAIRLKKPRFVSSTADVNLAELHVRDFVERFKPVVLNVAGPRGIKKGHEGIFDLVHEALVRGLK